jgi:hypothetical protein
MALAQRVKAIAPRVVRTNAGAENFMSSPMGFFDLITVKLGLIDLNPRTMGKLFPMRQFKGKH